MLKYDIVAIDKIVSKLLSEYEKSYHFTSPDPSVDIWKIAAGLGLKIEYVPSNQKLVFFEAGGKEKKRSIKGKHTVITTNGTIAINEKDRDSEVKCRFNIAHELAHVLLGHIDLPPAGAAFETVRKLSSSLNSGANTAARCTA